MSIKNQCETPNCPSLLSPSSLAYHCTFQCTFCPKCADQYDDLCPNCGNELVLRPRKDIQGSLLHIFRCKMDQLEAAANLFNQYRQFYQQSSDIKAATEFLQARLFQGESVIFLAKRKKEFVGFMQLYPTFSSVKMSSVWILNDLFVIPEARGQAVAQALVERATHFAKNRGAIRLILSTAGDNLQAQKLYEKLHFKKDQTFFHYALSL
jgi:ribosomal protein S18 acetylase RimI-like enzyme